MCIKWHDVCNDLLENCVLILGDHFLFLLQNKLVSVEQNVMKWSVVMLGGGHMEARGKSGLFFLQM